MDIASIFENLNALRNASKFNELLQGTTIRFMSGESHFVRVSKIQRVYRRPGLSFSKYIYRSEIESGSILEIGCGEGHTELLAFEKSIAEALERIVFRILKTQGQVDGTTNGWACHVSGAKAKTAALDELIERDGVLLHWLKEIPMIEILPTSFPADLKNWIQQDFSLHPSLRRLRILIADKGVLPSVVTTLQTDSGHAVASSAIAPSLSQAVAKALAETCRLASNIDDGYFFQSSIDLLSESGERTSPQDHGLLYAYHQPLPEWLFGTKSNWKDQESAWQKARSTRLDNSIQFDFTTIVEGPLHVGYGRSLDLQDLYFGQTKIAMGRGQINFTRLKKVGGEEFNLMPHFIA